MNFISGDQFKKLANFVFDEQGFYANNSVMSTTPIYFVKTDLVKIFFNRLLPTEDFILITHNSDIQINHLYNTFLEIKNLVKWFAQNVNYSHKKLIPIPIGIANPEWPHGNIFTLTNTIDKKHNKQQLLYANFNTKTNHSHRQYCLQHISSKFIENNVSFETYLTHTAKAYFSICPLGNGIDSHRIWESLYLKTIPIAESTYNIRYLKQMHDLPIILIDDWGSFNQLELNEKIYFQTLGLFNPNSLNIEKIV